MPDIETRIETESTLLCRNELQTDRLHLRRARVGDAAVLLHNYTGDPECSRFLQRRPHRDMAQTEAMLDRWCNSAWYSPDAPFSWVISTREKDEPIGVFVVIPEGHKTEFHYGICKRLWGQGLAVEAGAAALTELWRSDSTQRIWTVCDVDNIGSRRVLEKLRLTMEGTLKKWLVLSAYGAEARDCLVFATTRIHQ
jgi:[ribosomal protein S5]-alanine N-acetyltransferase